MADIKFEITETIGVLSENPKGWRKELNLVSWNGREPKYDLRDWSPDHEKMGKGITLNNDEFIKLKELLDQVDHRSLHK
ncbi:YdbC family protein [Halalkalibacter urbisdiaboli]|uniref:YdbC family protein n=1 Tax=Halalkalibacter urbisdiaboli TaxID=1960589 RepID=UPI000B444351|nr:YdbC family protein [Halalkalibacter urbisdiaboli]